MLDRTKTLPRPKPPKLIAWEQSEFAVQCSLVDALRKFAAADCLWLHIGNGEARDVITGAKLKRMGLRLRAADLLFLRPGSPALFLELKTSRGTPPNRNARSRRKRSRPARNMRFAAGLDDALALL